MNEDSKSCECTACKLEEALEKPLEVHLLSGVCPPKTSLKIIEEIEGLISQVNEKLDNLYQEQIGLSHNWPPVIKVSQALEEIDLFQKTTLVELRKAFE